MTSSTVELNLMSEQATRRSARMVAIGAVLFAAAIGGILGLVFGRLTGLIAALVVGVPLLLLAVADRRKRVWLDGAMVGRRGIGVRRVDIHRAQRMEIVVTDVRNRRTVGLLVAGPPRNKAVNIAVASYSGVAGVELGILALRKLADAFAGAEHSSGLVYSELLVAQLRAEARGAGAQDRPLHQLAAAAGDGRLARRVPADALVRFVANLD
jgi:hypothetical protein